MSIRSLKLLKMHAKLCYNRAMEKQRAVFLYTQEAVEYLKRRDKALGAAIEIIGPIERAVGTVDAASVGALS